MTTDQTSPRPDTEQQGSTRRPFNEGWAVRPKQSIFFELGGTSAAPEPVTLPHDALIGAKRTPSGEGRHTGFVPGGVFEYTKTFELSADAEGKRLSLEFEGAYRDAVVFVNDAFVGQRPSGYAGFVLEITDFVRFGEVNVVRVETRAHDDSRWYTGSGLYRDVWLRVTEPVHLDGVRVTTPEADPEQALVAVASSVRNQGSRPRTIRVRTRILGVDADVLAVDEAPVTVFPGETAVLRQRLHLLSPRLWSVDAPALHSVATTLVDGEADLEETTTVFGIRSLQLDAAHGLRINGEVVKLRGACVHHDNGPLGAATIARAEERRVQLLKDAGFNAIRSSHNPISPAMLDACDRLGMLVIDETFDVWMESKTSFDYSLSFPEWWERDVEAMVRKDFNHPSVIMYSIGNEIFETGSAAGARWGRLLAEKVRDLDPTRYVTNSINGFVSVIRDIAAMAQSAPAGGVNAVMNGIGEMIAQISASPLVTARTEEAFASVDAAGLNYGESRYELDATAFPNRIIVGTETAPPQIAKNWAKVLAAPQVIGDFTWTGWDYLGEVGIGRVTYADDTEPPMGASYPWRVAWCGDIDITGHRRPVSYWRETVFGLRSEPAIAVQLPENYARTLVPGQWAWSDSVQSWDWAVESGSPIKVEIYSDADEIELFVGDRSVGRAPAGAGVGFVTEFDITYARETLTAVAISDGAVVGRTALAVPQGGRGLSATPDRSAIRASTDDLSFVTIEVTDAAGTTFSARPETITVTVEGPGVLQALGSARPDSEESFLADTCETFYGRALAIIRPTGAGEISVRVRSASGLTADSLITAG